MKLSLILASRNNSAVLKRLLDSLTLCEKPDDWEVIVVDNGSIDNTAEIIRSYSDRLPVRYFYVKDRGKSRALNYGIRQAEGDLILFTDDDVIPASACLINHVRVMHSHPGINLVGGKITVNKAGLPSWLTHSYNLTGILVSEHDLGNTESVYASGRYPYGPNMAVRTKAVKDIDRPWPENMGPGTSLPVGDEMVFTGRVTSSRSERIYSPDCMVEHRPTLPKSFFIKSIIRCFLGGYAAGYYSKHSLSYKFDNNSLKLAGGRIRSCRSIREFLCIVSRAAGFFSGRIFQRLD